MNACREVLRKSIKELGLELLGYRVVPVDHSVPGPGAVEVEPVIEQVFVKAKDESIAGNAFERKLFVLRNHASHVISRDVKGSNNEFYITSFSARTIIYKGQLTDRAVARIFL